ncbi:DinB family protein [Edaphobacter bradus]|uniref:DinB family protein n=1 Tax=Edaphobacter bradus TaxID=2259016 RepID=UPI0021E07BEA|nr:DinB family protein [Edaphobacter bradus]
MDPNLEKLQQRIAHSLEGLTSAQTQLRTADSPDKWTIQQIAQHLCLSYKSTAGLIQERLAKGRPTRSRPTVPQHCARFLITGLGFFPSGREAPPMVVPPAASPSAEDHLTGAALAQETAELLQFMDKLFAEAGGRFGSGRSVSHGILGPLSVAQWRRFHLAHGCHHVKQILEIRRDHGI